MIRPENAMDFIYSFIAKVNFTFDQICELLHISNITSIVNVIIYSGPSTIQRCSLAPYSFLDSY